jgi:hypothetical protein
METYAQEIKHGREPARLDLCCFPSQNVRDNRGSRFNNVMVCELCKENGCKHYITPAYSPWVNRLVEGANKILLHVLKPLCAPDVGEQDGTEELEKHLKN